jgi:hypothetical protein
VIVQLSSLLSYAPYLLNTQIVNLAYVAVAVLLMTLITLGDLVLTLYPAIWRRGALAGPFNEMPLLQRAGERISPDDAHSEKS